MENSLIFFLVISILSITLLFIRKKGNPKTRNPPGPRGLPLIGNLHQLKSPLHEYFWQLSKKYGPLFYMKLGSRQVLVASSSRMAEEILKTQDLNFCSRPSLIALQKFSYDGFDIAFSPYSEYWREMRKNCVLHLLSVKRVQSYRPIREDEVSRMIEIISKHASLSETVDLTEMIMFLTSSVISRVVFGKRYEHGSGERKRFSQIILDFQKTLSEFFYTDYFPWIGWIDKITGKIDHLDKIFKIWDSYYQELIEEHLRPDKPKAMEDDVLDILLKLREEESFNLPMDHLKGVLMNLYFASTDTIGTTIIWAMTSLMKNPTVMKKVQEEIRNMSLLTKKQLVEEDDIKDAELPYFNAFIRESFRQYITIPLLLPRETIKRCTIDGYEIPAKTLVYVNVWAIAHDPELWKHPEEFIPERFLNENKSITKDLKGQDFDLIPFGAGRRGCPGISLAMATMQIVLANLLYLFDWELPDGLKNEDIDTDIIDGMTMHKKNPLCLVAKMF